MWDVSTAVNRQRKHIRCVKWPVYVGGKNDIFTSASRPPQAPLPRI